MNRKRLDYSGPSASTNECWGRLTTYPYTQTFYGTRTAHWYPEWNLIYDERRTYEEQFPSGRVVRGFKNCDHTRYSLTANCAPSWHRTYYTSEAYVAGATLVAEERIANAKISDLGAYGVNQITNVIGRAYDSGHFDRWNRTRPTMATRANLAVFALELLDVRRMFERIIPYMQYSLSAKSRREAAAKWISYCNNLHLNYNFGWKPYVRDLKNSFDAVYNFEKRYSRFLSEAEKMLHRNVRDDPQVVKTAVTSSWGYTPTWRSYEEYDFTIVRTSTFDYAYRLSEARAGLRWREWLDALGLNPSVATVWEVIPFSFVVDWFTDVGGYLQSLQTDWSQPDLTMIQSCYGWKATGTYTHSVLERADLGGTKFPAFSMYYEKYHRARGVPRFSGSTNPFDADKIRLGGSLLLSLNQRGK